MEQPHAAIRKGRPGLTMALTTALMLCPLQSALGQTLEFRGTPWAKAADPYGIEPALLYALTLVESRHLVAPGRVAPWPWTIHTPTGGHWFDSRTAARSALDDMLERWPAKRIDIGAAQIYVGWHGHRVEDPRQLLNLQFNLHVAAAILDRAIESTLDPILGVGRYHTWADEVRARSYGLKVWRMYYKILSGGRSTVGRYVLGLREHDSMSGQQLAERR